MREKRREARQRKTPGSHEISTLETPGGWTPRSLAPPIPTGVRHLLWVKFSVSALSISCSQVSLFSESAAVFVFSASVVFPFLSLSVWVFGHMTILAIQFLSPWKELHRVSRWPVLTQDPQDPVFDQSKMHWSQNMLVAPFHQAEGPQRLLLFLQSPLHRNWMLSEAGYMGWGHAHCSEPGGSWFTLFSYLHVVAGGKKKAESPRNFLLVYRVTKILSWKILTGIRSQVGKRTSNK